MKRELTWLVGLLTIAIIAVPGCLGRKPSFKFSESDLAHYETVATEIEYADVTAPCDDDVVGARRPRSILEDSTVEYKNMSLEEAIHLALTNSKVLRDLGGTVLRSPENLQTPYGSAIQESDPQFGVEAALSAFDAEFATSLFFEKNDRLLNNRSLGRDGFFQQDFDIFQAELTKRAATGSQFTLRKNVDYDNNSSLGNRFPSVWNVNVEAEARHPLLQRGGLKFNRIAGPDGTPGVVNGVLIARIRTDITLAEFELGLRDFLANVENAYWDLYYAYRDLDAKIKARNMSLETWHVVNALYEADRKGGERDKEYQAREQFFRFEEEVQNALTGRQLEGTRTNNGSSPGTFRGSPGVQLHERRLRLLLGLPLNGDRLIRPSDEPSKAPVTYDWNLIVDESLVRRAELRRQRWQVKKREMELVASRNFLLPNLDLVGRYRWRGFGNKLLNSDSTGLPQYDNAYMNLTDGDFQEWLLGAEFSVPLGFRQAHAAVRNAQLQLARAKAVLSEQERQVVHDVSNAWAEKERAYTVMRTSYNRSLAAEEQRKALDTLYRTAPEGSRPEFFVVLDAQRRAADAEIRYYQAQIEYALALRNVHFEKGSLLDYCGVVFSEGPWPNKAYVDAARLESLRGRPRPINYQMNNPPIVSQGVHPHPATRVHSQTWPAGAVPLPEASAPPTPTPAPPPPISPVPEN